MSLPAIIKKNELVTQKMDFYLEQRINLLQAEAVQLKLSENDLMIASAGVEVPIRNITDEELIKSTAIAAKFICRDIGVKHWDNPDIMQYDAARFFTTLKTYYKDLTIKEVKLAFELAAVGQLDDWLPKDKYGKPDKNHYQGFTVEYYTKILNAYRVKKSKVWNKARLALPAAVEIISKEQRAFNHNDIVQDIYNAFEIYKSKGVAPRFVLSVYINKLIEQGAIKKKPKASKSSLERAYRTYITSSAPRREKQAVIANYHLNKIDAVLLTHAESIENNKRIETFFKSLIKKDLDIKTVINR